MNKRIWALIAAWTVAIIYGVTFTIAKDVMPKYIDAFGFILLRVGGAAIFFWLISLFVKTEKIKKEDFYFFFLLIGSYFFLTKIND